MQGSEDQNFSLREISSLVRLLESGTEENIKLALAIFEGNPKHQEILNKIKKEPRFVLQCLKEGHQQILSKLRFIYLRRVGLSSLPVNIKHLEHIIMLDLGYNQIQTLPKEIFTLKTLKKLRLHHNQLKYISPEIQHLENLEELMLDNNQIQTLPNSIFQLKKLKKLGLNYNPFSTKELKQIRSQFPHIQFNIT